MGRRSSGRSGGHAGSMEVAGRYIDLDPELEVDPPSFAQTGRGKTIGVHLVPEWMRATSADCGRMADRRGGVGESSRDTWRTLPIGIWGAPAELASGAAASRASSGYGRIMGRCPGSLCEGLWRRTGNRD